jgi:hypothetical protein
MEGVESPDAVQETSVLSSCEVVRIMEELKLGVEIRCFIQALGSECRLILI